MAVYKGNYTLHSDGTCTVNLYTDNTITQTHHNVGGVDASKSMILVWHAQQGYTRPDITDQNFTEDWDNFDSLYVKS